MVDALRILHHALVPDGRVVDTQPLSPRPAVFTRGRRLGSLDMRQWARTVASVDSEMQRALGEGLFALDPEVRIVVTDTFDSGSECLDEVREWAGTTVPRALEARIRAAPSPITLEQEVRLRLLAKLA